MAFYLPNGTKRPVLDITSENLIFIWNMPKWVNIGEIKKTLQPRYGWIKFVETFEAWTEGRKLGQIILQFGDPKKLDDFVKALSKKQEFNYEGLEFMRFDPDIGSGPFFNFVKQKSGVDLLACGGVPPTFDYKHKALPMERTNSNFRPPSRPRGSGRGGGRSTTVGHFTQNSNKSERTDEELNSCESEQMHGGNGGEERGSFGSRPLRSLRGRVPRGGYSNAFSSFLDKNTENSFAPPIDNEGLEPESTPNVVKDAEDGPHEHEINENNEKSDGCQIEGIPEVDEAFGINGNNEEKNGSQDEEGGEGTKNTEDEEQDGEERTNAEEVIDTKEVSGGGENEQELTSDKLVDGTEEEIVAINAEQHKDPRRADSGQGTSPSRASSNSNEARKHQESPQFTQYRDKSRSREDSESSEDAKTPRNTMKITNLKPGFDIDKLLEVLQSGGDIVAHRALDKTTAVFTFLEEAEASNASIYIDSDLAGPEANFVIMTEEQALLLDLNL